MQTPRTLAGQRGFSMIELMVAMVITLVVSGAIFGLLTVGGNAFRREPEVADRQQNIRIAMDSIMRDITNAGSGMPLMSQMFTHTDTANPGANSTGAGAPFLNGLGPQGVMGPAGMALRGGGPTGSGADTSDNSDVLEIVTADEACPSFHVCTAPAPPPLDGTAAALLTLESIPAGGCMLSSGTGLVLLTDAAQLFTIQPATLNGNGSACGGTSNGSVNLGVALPQWPTASAIGVAQALMYTAHVVRYMIAPGLDPVDNSPSLWRSDTGRYDPANAGAGPIWDVPAANRTNWQLIARGIEDLQVEYLNGSDLWSNNPDVVPACAPNCNYGRVVRRVRVTLSARAIAPRLLGETTPAGGAAPNAVRGQLVSIGTPRAAVLGLQSPTVSAATGWQ